jgi:diguanylate cyclase (GGDEF)-like protein
VTPYLAPLDRNMTREARATWEPGEQASVTATLFIDLDRFRSFKGVFGQDVGDALLIEVGRRLSAIASGHFVSRTGGDEFTIHCVGIGIEEADRLGNAIMVALGKPYDVRGRPHHLTASVGVAHFDTAEGAELRQAADQAMYIAKRRGGNRTITFTPLMRAATIRLVELEQELYKALSYENELALERYRFAFAHDSALCS